MIAVAVPGLEPAGVRGTERRTAGPLGRAVAAAPLLAGIGAFALACASAPPATPAPSPASEAVTVAEPLPAIEVAATDTGPEQAADPVVASAARAPGASVPLEPLAPGNDLRIRLEQERSVAALLLEGPGLSTCSWRPISADRLRVSCPAAGSDGVLPRSAGAGPVEEVSLVSANPLQLVLQTRGPVVARWSSSGGSARLELRADRPARVDASRSAMTVPPPLEAAETASPRPPRVPREPADPAPEPPADGRYELQLAAFAVPENAESALRHWRDLGFEPYLVPFLTRSGRELQTLRLGPWDDREAAEALAARLLREHGQDSLVQRRRPEVRPGDG